MTKQHHQEDLTSTSASLRSPEKMECYEGWAEEEADYYGWCRRHPSQPRHAVCAACLRERLSLLCPHCARPRPCRICEPSSSSSSAAMTFDATSSSTNSSDLSLDVAGDAAAIGSVAPMSHFLGEPSFSRSRSTACGRAPPVAPAADRRRLAPPAEAKPPRSSVSSSSSFLLFWKSSVKKEEAKGKVAEGLYRSRTVAGGGRGGCQREAAAAAPEMKGRGWNFRSPMKAFRLSKAEKMLPQRPPLCKG